MPLSIVSVFLIGFNVALVFEGVLKKENEREHFGWFCYLSVTSGKKDFKRLRFPDHGMDERRYLTSQEIMEIRNIVDEMLEMEEDEDESYSSETVPGNDAGGEGDDNASADDGNTS